MTRHPHRRVGARRARIDPGRGSTLIELMLATLLFLVALLAAAPLFMRAVRDVRTGATRSAAAVLAQNALEGWRPSPGELGATPAPALEYYSFEAREWLPAPPPPPDRALWVRRTTVRRYPLGAIADGRLDRGEAGPPEDDRPRLALVAVEVEVLRRLGSPPIATLERLEWIVG